MYQYTNETTENKAIEARKYIESLGFEFYLGATELASGSTVETLHLYYGNNEVNLDGIVKTYTNGGIGARSLMRLSRMIKQQLELKQ